MDTIARLPSTHLRAAAALGTARLLAREARPAVQAVFLLRFVSTALAPDPSLSIVLETTGWLLVTVAIYLLNGLSDLVGDQVNGSSRPLAAGHLDVATARSAVTACGLIGVSTCFCSSLALGALSIAMLALGVGYSYGPCWKAGRLAASTVIGAGAGLTYMAGAMSAGVASWDLIIFTTAVSVWIGAASASKDFSDVTGDRIAGRHTIPVDFGYAVASRRLAMTTTAATAMVVCISTAVGSFSLTTGVIISGTAVLAFVLTMAPAAGPWFPGRTPYRIYMVTQYTACAGLLACALG